MKSITHEMYNEKDNLTNSTVLVVFYFLLQSFSRVTVHHCWHSLTMPYLKDDSKTVPVLWVSPRRPQKKPHLSSFCSLFDSSLLTFTAIHLGKTFVPFMQSDLQTTNKTNICIYLYNLGICFACIYNSCE